jgi:DNA-binding NarL/FixJ family response regulator
MIRVLLVDDQPLVRAGMRLILEPEPDLEIAGECSDGDEVLAAVERWRPDVVIMDVRMRRMDGATATRLLHEKDDAPPVLILKDAPGEELIRATRIVAGGGAWLDHQITGRVLETFRRVSGRTSRAGHRLDQLTDRERDVLREVATGANNQEVAAALFISEATVKTHLGNILAKLDLRDRAAVIVFAHTHGFA